MIVDVHMHFGYEHWKPPWSPTGKGDIIPVATEEEFIKYMDLCKIDKGIVNSFRSMSAQRPDEVVKGNDEIAEFVARYPDRLLGGCVVDAAYPLAGDVEMERCRNKYNMVWAGEFHGDVAGFSYESEEFEAIIRKAVELKMILHLFASTEEMGRMAAKHRDTVFVVPHFGSDGKSIAERIKMVAENPNVYLDISGTSIVHIGLLEYAVKKIGADRLLFGSDFIQNDPATVICRVENATLSRAEKDAILSGNILRLLEERGVKLA